MLEIVKYNCDEYEFPCLLVLGCFDSIHIGHSELLKKAKLQAKINGLDLGVMTFTDGKDDGKQVYTFEEKLSVFEEFNVKFVLKIDYDEEFKKTPPLDFLHNLEEKLNIKAYMSGKDFRFGAGAKGKSSTLKKYAEDDDSGVWYMPVKEVLLEDEKVGTSVIKRLLADGNVKKAAEELGRNFFVSGVVQGGHERGTSLGFPTVNIHYPDNKVAVKQGVYSAVCTVDGKDYNAVLNFGGRPTFGEEECVLEVHIVDFSGDLYGKTVTVQFVDYLREIEKFDCPEELCSRIESDIAITIGGNVSNKEQPVEEEQPADLVMSEEQPENGNLEQAEQITAEEQPAEQLPGAEEISAELACTEQQPAEELPENGDTEQAEQIPVETPAEENND